MEPITGVISSHNVAWEFVDNEICLGCEAIEQNIREDVIYEDEDAPLQDALDCIECFDHEKLIGDWKKNSAGLWERDEGGEFAAIATDSTFNCVQVVWSKWTTNVRAMCSPCFPGQADLDSGEGNIIAYTLPDYLLSNQEFIDVEKE